MDDKEIDEDVNINSGLRICRSVLKDDISELYEPELFRLMKEFEATAKKSVEDIICKQRKIHDDAMREWVADIVFTDIIDRSFSIRKRVPAIEMKFRNSDVI